MFTVLSALVPGLIVYVWYFGWGIVVTLLIAAGAALIAEAAMLRLRGRELRPALTDGSALVTAALLAFAVPPLLPWWVPALAAGVAIILGKQLYGGLGANLFNPAMVGYVVVLISFPIEMIQWLPPRGSDLPGVDLGLAAHLGYALTAGLPDGQAIDAVTQATPLDLTKVGLANSQTLPEIQVSPLVSSLGGHGWLWTNIWIALGGLYLLYRGIIGWQIPAAVLLGLLIPASAFYLVDASRFPAPAFHLFAGAALLGAFFIATDPVTAAASNRGRLIYGAGIGVLAYAIRTWGGYPEGLAFAVLLMNTSVPLIDRYTQPRIYGHD
jgi:electron transport complex protein RnfD